MADTNRLLTPEEQVALRELLLDSPFTKTTLGQLRRRLPPCDVNYCGHRMRVWPSQNYTDFMIWLHGKSPESRSIDALANHIDNRDVRFMDIGANSGSFSIALSEKIGPNGCIVAFEPNILMVQRLRYNFKLSGIEGRAEIHDVALSDVDGWGLLSIPQHNFGAATILESKLHSVWKKKVRVRSILSFLPTPPDLREMVIKVDVEGNEDRVLLPLVCGVLEGVCSPKNLPSGILCETRHRSNWSRDINQILLEVGYETVFEGEGNSFYVRPMPLQ